MGHRGLAVVALAALAPAAAALLPADARADRHGMECFGGYSAGSGSSLKGGSISCGIYVDYLVKSNDLQDAQQQPLPSPSPSPYLPPPPPPPPAPPPPPGTSSSSQPLQGTSGGSGPAAGTAAPLLPARRWFLVADVNRMTGDSDVEGGADVTRHLITLGFQRYLFVREPGDYARPKRWHPFLRALGGLSVTGGRHPAEYGPALAGGGGIDLRVWESRKAHGWGNLFLRGQCDVAYLFDPGQTVWRCSAGPSFRDEDY